MSKQKIYTRLKEINLTGDYNFYGVIIDATFPVFEDKENLYHCTIKVIDLDKNCLFYLNSYGKKIFNLIVKSSEKENLPYIHAVGDIIRVHQGVYIYNKNNVYLNLTNISNIKSSWCIFQGASDLNSNDYNPIGCSSKNFIFENQDKQMLDNIRFFIKLYFNSKNSLVYHKEFKLTSRNLSSPGDNDVLVQIVNKTEMDDKVVYFIQDETDGCELHAFKYFNIFEINDVIRLRSFKVFDKSSNILKIPPSTGLYKYMINKIAVKLKNNNPNAIVPMFMSTGERKFYDLMMANAPTNFRIVTLYDDTKYKIKSINEITEQDDKFILNVNVFQIYPQVMFNFVSVLCLKCLMSCYTREIENLTSENKFNCKLCKTVDLSKFYYNVQLVCRENAYSNKLITLNLSTFDNQGNGFFSVPAMDFYRNTNEYKKLKGNVLRLQEIDCYITVLIEAIPTWDSNRVYRIIGDYHNNLAY